MVASWVLAVAPRCCPAARVCGRFLRPGCALRAFLRLAACNILGLGDLQCDNIPSDLQANLPAGAQLEPRHLWLLVAPDAVHPGVWLVAALAALDALAGVRRFMAALQADAAVVAQRAVQPARRAPVARQLTLASVPWPAPGPGSCVGWCARLCCAGCRAAVLAPGLACAG